MRMESLKDCRVSFVGRFASMTHDELAELVVGLGGSVDRFPSRGTRILAVGTRSVPLDERGKPHQAIVKAKQLAAMGYGIEILTEESFWQRCDLVDGETISRRYTIGQLSNLLGVGRDQLRLWMRAGLINPVETAHRLAFFDLAEVQNAKMFCELTKRGHTVSDIRRSLDQLHQWIPALEVPSGQLSILEEDGRLLARYDDDCLIEPSGQLRFSFDSGGDALRPLTYFDFIPSYTVFDRAVALEDAGRWAEAADAYQVAISRDPSDAIAHFNLANVEYTRGDREAAVAAYLRTVQMDGEHAEAWNNLGCVLSELDRCQEAVVALEHAIELVPAYGDAHFNLADCYDDLGKTDRARLHWQRYLELDTEGEWAEEAKHRLLESAPEESRCS